jgi:hypothetical protein
VFYITFFSLHIRTREFEQCDGTSSVAIWGMDVVKKVESKAVLAKYLTTRLHSTFMSQFSSMEGSHRSGCIYRYPTESPGIITFGH